MKFFIRPVVWATWGFLAGWSIHHIMFNIDIPLWEQVARISFGLLLTFGTFAALDAFILLTLWRKNKS